MQKITFLLCMILGAFSSSAQTEISTKNNIDSISSYIATLLEDIDRRLYKNELNDRYRFYPTENIYNFLKLDIRTGRIAQVQWSLDISKEGSVSINSDDLSCGRGSLFELYPTKNMYQFLLLDKSNGRAWHVQWGLKDKERWIRSIY